MASELETLMKKYKVENVSLSTGCIVEDNTSIQDVIALMKSKKTGCMVLTKGKKVTGIFTERDYLVKVVNEKIDWTTPIHVFATLNPAVMKASESLGKALLVMKKKNFRNIPIFTNDGEFSGILSIQNVIRLLAEHFPAEVMNLPPVLNRYPTETEGG